MGLTAHQHKKVISRRNMMVILSIYLSIYLSIFLYVLTPEGDIRRVPVNQVLKGVSWNKSIGKGGEMSLYSVNRVLV